MPDTEEPRLKRLRHALQEFRQSKIASRGARVWRSIVKSLMRASGLKRLTDEFDYEHERGAAGIKPKKVPD